MVYVLKKIAVITLIALVEAMGVVNVLASSVLPNIKVFNTPYKAMVLMSFNSSPSYNFFLLHEPERLVLDAGHKSKVFGLPLSFIGQHRLLKNVRYVKQKHNQSMRLVFDLNHHVKIHLATNRKKAANVLVLTLTAVSNSNASLVHKKSVITVAKVASQLQQIKLAKTGENSVINKPRMIVNSSKRVASDNSTLFSKHSAQIIVAIDAGHGGQDPGAIGWNGLKEKNVSSAVAYRLKMLLDDDPQFKPILTRNGDYFVSVMRRSDVARKQNANVLVSIHADSATNRTTKGASLWVLSNYRAKSEITSWLEQHNKQSELLGGAGDMLANRGADPYLRQVVLDLQFDHSQRVGYDMAIKVLQQLDHIAFLHKRLPKHASLGVLRSPDIPSLLIETGFISNIKEERLLGSSSYQYKIAKAIYHGLRNYFLVHPLEVHPKMQSRYQGIQASVKLLGTDRNSPVPKGNLLVFRR